jgi:hypothetical protein
MLFLPLVALAAFCGAAFAVTGILSIRSEGDKIDVTIDKVQLKHRARQLKHGTEQAVEVAKEVGGVVYDTASEDWQKARRRLREFSHDRKRPVMC